jgi:hypothetical protein
MRRDSRWGVESVLRVEASLMERMAAVVCVSLVMAMVQAIEAFRNLSRLP